MTWKDVKLATLQKMFSADGGTLVEDETTKDYLAGMPQAANEALALLCTSNKYLRKSALLEKPRGPAKFTMKDQAEDFWAFGTPEVYRMENGLPYKTYAYSIVAGRDIIFPAEEAGQYEVFYNAWPPQITGETLDDSELPRTPDVVVLLPLYMASQLYKDDDNSIATIYRNEFEVARGELVPAAGGVATGEWAVKDGWC